MLTYTVLDEPIVLESDSRSEGGDENFDTTHAIRTLDCEQPGHDALHLEILPTSLNRSADKCEDGDNNINNNQSQRPAKRQRSASPCCEPNLHSTSTSPLSYNESEKGSMEDINGGDRSESISAEDGLASTTRTTAATSDCPPLLDLPVSPQMIDTNQEWEARKIIGKENVDGVLHYLVEWCPTLEPEHSLGHAKELLVEFEEKLRARRRVKSGKADTATGQQQKRLRGQPRKQK